MCKVDNRRKIDTLGEWCVVSKSKCIKVLGIVRLESGFFFHLGDFLPFPSDCQELMMFHMPMNAPSAAHCLWLWTEQEVFITRAGPKFGAPVEIFNFFLIERVETLQLSDMTLQKWWADSLEVFPGQSATNNYFAFQVLAYKHRAKNTFGNTQLSQSLGNENFIIWFSFFYLWNSNQLRINLEQDSTNTVLSSYLIWQQGK